MKNFYKSIYDLIVKASTDLPNDVRDALEYAKQIEYEGTRSLKALESITLNNQMSVKNESPMCQDTGMPNFKIYTPIGVNQVKMQRDIEKALSDATKNSKLRPNAVCPLTGKNSGNNLGDRLPRITFHQWEEDYIDVKFMLKGGGSENKSIQYTLPDDLPGIGKAGRDLDGVRKCILHSIYQAQGQGCSPGFLGVGIGGDRTGSYETAKEQFWRFVDDENKNPILNNLEKYIMDKAQKFGIGTLGFGGQISLLSCKIGTMYRLPASFFVSVIYMCWAFRRLGVKIDPVTGDITEWTYERPSKIKEKLQSTIPVVDNLSDNSIINLTTPISEEQVRKLKVGDIVSISGKIYTGRDAVHKYLYDKTDNESPVDFTDGVIYHCGPVLTKESEKYIVKAAGPTTSIREEPYQADIMKRYGIRVVIGKGGMGKKTSECLKEYGGVYLNAIGGAAQYYAQSIKSVDGVDLLEELGAPEAIWHLNVEDFRAVVTMDAHGESLHDDIEKSSFEVLESMSSKVF